MKPDLQDINRRLDRLALTKGGWYDGDGEAMDPRAVQAAREMFVIIGTTGYEAMAITISGGILMDWTGKHSVVVTIGPDGTFEICGDIVGADGQRQEVFLEFDKASDFQSVAYLFE